MRSMDLGGGGVDKCVVNKYFRSTRVGNYVTCIHK